MAATAAVAAALVAMPLHAQRRNAKTAQPQAEQKTAAEVLYDEMLPSTARVLVFDSVVTSREDFINHITLGRESGTITAYNDYFNTKGQTGMHVFVNELGNKRYYSRTDTAGHTKLYVQDRSGGQWSGEQEIADFGDDYTDIINPFMMADGQTFYFAARGDNGLGGYDLYVTRYDAAGSRFYRPENIGLPYNSEGDDICIVIDEYNAVGWLVTDRRQPEGRVCIYTFVPQSSREVYDDVSDGQLQSLAALTSIKETWTDKTARADALARLRRLREESTAGNDGGNDISFVINDRLTYHSVQEFRTAAQRERFARLQAARERLNELEAALAALRCRYAEGNSETRQSLRADILAAEDETYALRNTIRQEEKEIRNAENRALGS